MSKTDNSINGASSKAIREIETIREMKVVLLGTAGGPRIHLHRCCPSQAVRVGEHTILVDCGEGTTRQLVAAGISLKKIRNVFITHLHSDHISGLGGLLTTAWLTGMSEQIVVWGPPPLRSIVDGLMAANEWESYHRVRAEGRIPLSDLVAVREIESPQVVELAGSIIVRAGIVDHPPCELAFAYRIDSPHRSITISGDTAPSEGLIKLAYRTDILVHEVMHLGAMRQTLGTLNGAPDLADLLETCHTPHTEVGGIATSAKVGTLVLSHLVPADYGVVSDEEWLTVPRVTFAGNVILGQDQIEL